jgi:hypothetical protein
MTTKLEKSLIKEISFNSVTQRLLNDLKNFSISLTTNLRSKNFSINTFMDLFNSLGYEQKEILIKSYLESSFSLLSTTLNANMGTTNETASTLFNFLLKEGFSFNKADLEYLKKHNNFAFKKHGSFGDVYEVTWYYPLNKWADKAKRAFLKAINKEGSPIYLIQYPSEKVWNSLLYYYQKLPVPVQSIVLRSGDEQTLKFILLNKTNESNAEDLNFFKKTVI